MPSESAEHYQEKRRKTRADTGSWPKRGAFFAACGECFASTNYFRSCNPHASMIVSPPGVNLRILSAMTARSETVAFLSRRLK
jgi:hypothetical protein